jgi:inhibitor of cysteine peptidase
MSGKTMQVAAVLLMLICGATAARSQTTMPEQATTLTQQDNGRTVSLPVGQTATLSLPENATTGYRWAIDSIDSAIIAVGGEQPRYPSGPPGSGGHVEWTLTAKAPGSTDLRLKLWRSWEGDASIAERFSVRFQVIP